MTPMRGSSRPPNLPGEFDATDALRPLRAEDQHLEAAVRFEKDHRFGRGVVALHGFANGREQHRGFGMRLKSSRYLRHGRVAGLVLTDSDEAASARDREGAAGTVDGVGDVHGSRPQEEVAGASYATNGILRRHRVQRLSRPMISGVEAPSCMASRPLTLLTP